MERSAYEYFAKIEELGGMVEAVKRNFPQREIAEASWRYQQEVDAKQRVVVGVNRYQHAEKVPIEIHRIADELEKKQIGRLQATRARRDASEVERTLGTLKEAAGTSGRNLMYPLIDCARANTSEGEMIEALQQVFGAYTESPVF
jgi:methylmalonyl-CoA mutase, N-terminal domain